MVAWIAIPSGCNIRTGTAELAYEVMKRHDKKTVLIVQDAVSKYFECR